MKKVYNSLKDIKYTIDYRSAEIYMKYAILYNIYGIIANIIKIINIIGFIVISVLSIIKIISFIYLIIAIAIILIELGISKYCRNAITYSHKQLVLYIINDVVDKFSNPNELDLDKLIIEELAPIAGLEFVQPKE